ncbi:MAG: hypothetical protein AAB653_01530, partial [Patescibacteria group bacterium]
GIVESKNELFFLYFVFNLAKAPLAEMFGYATQLRSMSQGRASYNMEFSHYSEASRNIMEKIIGVKEEKKK